MSCSRVNHLLSAYIDNELSGIEQMMVRQHLRQCEMCRDEYDSLLWTKRVLSTLPAQVPSEGFENRILQVISDEDACPSRRSFWTAIVATLHQPISGRTGMGLAAAAFGCAAVALVAAAERPAPGSRVTAANVAPVRRMVGSAGARTPVQDLFFVHDPNEATQVGAYRDVADDPSSPFVVSPASNVQTPLEPLR